MSNADKVKDLIYDLQLNHRELNQVKNFKTNLQGEIKNVL